MTPEQRELIEEFKNVFEADLTILIKSIQKEQQTLKMHSQLKWCFTKLDRMNTLNEKDMVVFALDQAINITKSNGGFLYYINL